MTNKKPTLQQSDAISSLKKDQSQYAQCTLSNEELLTRVKEWVGKLAATGGHAWTLRVPVDFNHDPDMLIIELCNRFSKELKQ